MIKLILDILGIIVPSILFLCIFFAVPPQYRRDVTYASNMLVLPLVMIAGYAFGFLGPIFTTFCLMCSLSILSAMKTEETWLFCIKHALSFFIVADAVYNFLYVKA